MNGPSAERRMRRVAKQVEALPMVPQNYEERYAQIGAALLAGTRQLHPSECDELVETSDDIEGALIR